MCFERLYAGRALAATESPARLTWWEIATIAGLALTCMLIGD